jgi:hypothetical protein
MLRAFGRKLRNYSTHFFYTDFAGIRYKKITVSECSNPEVEGSNTSRSNARFPVFVLSCEVDVL